MSMRDLRNLNRIDLQVISMCMQSGVLPVGPLHHLYRHPSPFPYQRPRNLPLPLLPSSQCQDHKRTYRNPACHLSAEPIVHTHTNTYHALLPPTPHNNTPNHTEENSGNQNHSLGNSLTHVKTATPPIHQATCAAPPLECLGLF